MVTWLCINLYCKLYRSGHVLISILAAIETLNFCKSLLNLKFLNVCGTCCLYHSVDIQLRSNHYSPLHVSGNFRFKSRVLHSISTFIFHSWSFLTCFFVVVLNPLTRTIAKLLLYKHFLHRKSQWSGLVTFTDRTELTWSFQSPLSEVSHACSSDAVMFNFLLTWNSLCSAILI